MHITEKNEVQKQANITVPFAEIAGDVHKQLIKTRREMALPGFRRGNVPMPLVKKNYEQSIIQRLAFDTLDIKIKKIIEEHKVNLCSSPRVVEEKKGEDNNFEYVVEFDIFPEVTIPDLTQYSWPYISSEVTDADIEKLVLDLRKGQAKRQKDWRYSQEGAAMENLVNFSVSVTDGTVKDLYRDIEIELSSHTTKLFLDQILGKKAGDKVDFTSFSYPKSKLENKDFHADNSPQEESTDTEYNYSIGINKVQQLEMPALDEKLYEAYGVKGGRAEFDTKITEDMNRYLRDRLHQINFAALQDSLREHIAFALADSVVEEQQKYMLQNLTQQLKGQKIPDDFPLDGFKEPAEKTVRNQLIYNALIQHFDIVVKDDEIEAELDLISKEYQQSEEYKQAYKAEQNKMRILSEKLQQIKLLATVVKQSKVEIEHKSYFDIFEKQQ